VSTTTVYPVMSRRVQPDKVACDWCWLPATWKINDEHSLAGYANACTAHGTEWFPSLFPGSDRTPIESIISAIPVLTEWEADLVAGRHPVSLIKVHDQDMVAASADWHLAKRHAQTSTPWYPLVGHREGLRSNDLITLASAFWILALEGGTAHLTSTPEWERHPHAGN
jgi:hypothetical protein